MSLNLSSPLFVGGSGRTATVDDPTHIEAMLERLLFTGPGERVMRPNFGTGLGQIVFAGASTELAIATRFLVEGAIQQWLGDLISVEQVDTAFSDGLFTVSIQYALLATDERVTTTFERVA